MESHSDEYEHWNYEHDKHIFSAHSGKGRSKREAQSTHEPQWPLRPLQKNCKQASQQSPQNGAKTGQTVNISSIDGYV